MKIYRTSPKEELHRISREAAEWVQVMNRSPTREEREAFLAWVAASPLNLRETLVADTVDKALARPGALDGFDLDQVLAQAARDDNVVSLRTNHQTGTATPPAAPPPVAALPGMAAAHTRATQGRRTGRRRSRRWSQVAALAAMFAVGLVVWQFGFEQAPSQQYASAIGEQRVIALADGSRVSLAPRSRISVAFSEDAREIELISGEADFKVAHDRARPFRVRAGASIIQAIGTQFTVNRLPSGTIVAVSEGKVRMTTHANDSLRAGFKAWLDGSSDGQDRSGAGDAKSLPLQARADLSAGQAVRIATSGRRVTPLPYTDSLIATSATRRLTFHEDTLADIIAEFNRYNARQVMIDGDEIGLQRYSGVFNADDADSFLQFLECCTNLSVARNDEHTRVSATAAGRQ